MNKPYNIYKEGNIYGGRKILTKRGNNLLMNFVLAGIDYKNALIEVRENIHFYDKDKIESLSYFSENFLEEALILSTWNMKKLKH